MVTSQACDVCGRNLLGRERCRRHPEAGILLLADPEERSQARLLRDLALERWDRGAAVLGGLAVWLVGTLAIRPRPGPWLEGPLAGLAMLGFALPMLAGLVLVVGRIASPRQGWRPVPGAVVLGWAGASVGGAVLFWMVEVMARIHWRDPLFASVGELPVGFHPGPTMVVLAMLGAVLLLLGTGALLGRWTARAIG